MKRLLLFLCCSALILGSCSSLPKKERLVPVTAKKEQAALYLSRGHNEYNWSNYESSVNFYTKSYQLAASVDWQEGMIRSLVHLSRSQDRLGLSSESLENLEYAEEFLVRHDDEVLSLLAGNRRTEWLLFNRGSADALEQGLSMAETAGPLKVREAGESWRILAAVYKKEGNLVRALEAVEKAVSLDNSQNFTAELASDYYIRSSILSLSGKTDEALESMYSALEMDKYIENTASIAQDLYGLALIYEKAGNDLEASHYFLRSYIVYSSSGGVPVPDNLVDKIRGFSGNLLPGKIGEL